MEIDILKMLERKDKWYLGGGNRLLWTPPFPLHLDRPGAWDFVSYFDLRIDPGYTISVIDRGVPVDFICIDRLWNPASLSSLFRAGDLEMLEEKALLKEDFLASRVTLKNDSKEMKELDIVVWTAQQCSDSDSEVDTQIIDAVGSGIVFKKRLVSPGEDLIPLT